MEPFTALPGPANSLVASHRIPQTETAVAHAARRYFDAKRPSVRLARQFVTITLTSWGITGEPIEDICLCASELTSNALTHGTRRGHGFLVSLSTFGDLVRLEVHDSRDATAERLPQVRQATGTQGSGRGLRIVESLAQDWGVDRREPFGKVVWSHFKAVPEDQQTGVVQHAPRT
ncbi:ATP-binding protein [Streptomyces sp. CS7]|uniref:ATP-binding protein n=1 Tax=Streptomyces sp. CS-7 TaxID=2906769 RepID=UPI0021B36C05|nr:ATP-binding protein [Streptomyces sp. CS-7]MCT6780645.1 ATP-binding protein [Streptomyces sp. CS-7]